MRPPPLPSALLFPSLLLAVIAQMRSLTALLLGNLPGLLIPRGHTRDNPCPRIGPVNAKNRP